MNLGEAMVALDASLAHVTWCDVYEARAIKAAALNAMLAAFDLGADILWGYRDEIQSSPEEIEVVIAEKRAAIANYRKALEE